MIDMIFDNSIYYLYPKLSKSLLKSGFATKHTIESFEFSSKKLGIKIKKTYYPIPIFFHKKSSIIIASYPHIFTQMPSLPKNIEYFIRLFNINIFKIIFKNSKLILYPVDLKIEQMKKTNYKISKKDIEIERKIFRSFDIICVFNEKMKEYLIKNYDISNDKILIFEILDYHSNFIPIKNNKNKLNKTKKIVWGGNLSRDYLGCWIDDIPQNNNIIFEFYGKEGNWINKMQREDMNYRGFLSNSNEYIRNISEKDFALIDCKENLRDYFKYTIPSKFRSSIVAGLPLLVNHQLAYARELVLKYNIGFIYKKHQDIPNIVNNISIDKYTSVRENVLNLAEKIRTGYFFNKTIKKAIERLNKGKFEKND